MKKPSIFILLILLCSSFIFATDLKSIDYATLEESNIIKDTETKLKNNFNTDEALKELKIKGYEKRGGTDFYDVDIIAGSNTIKLKKVKNPNSIHNISVIKNPNKNGGTDVLTINTPDIESSSVILEKYFSDYLELKHSDDGINFITVPENTYFQNETHLWFNTSEYSSWTGTLPKDRFFPEFDRNMILSISDITTALQPTDYITIDVYDACTSSTKQLIYTIGTGDITSFVKIQDDNCFDAVDVELGVDSSRSGDSDIYVFVVPDSTPSSDVSFIFGDGKLYNNGNVLQDSEFDVLDLTYEGTYEQPIPATQGVTNLAETTVTLAGRVDFNDLRYISNYYVPDVPEGDKLSRICVYDVADSYSSAGCSSWVATSHLVTDTENFIGLTGGTEYSYVVEFDAYNPVTKASVFYVSSTPQTAPTFTTISNEPTVTSISPLTGETSAYFRALVDYKTYGGNDLGLYFEYREVGTTPWIRIPTAGFEVPTDDVIFVSSEVTGLTTGTQYEVISHIVWNAGTQFADGETLLFTPQTQGTGDITSNLLAHWEFETSNPTQPDSTGNGYNCAVTGATFDSSTSAVGSGSYIWDGNDYMLCGNPAFASGSWTLSYWAKLTGTGSYRTVDQQNAQQGGMYNGINGGVPYLGIQYSGSGSATVTATSNVNNNQWRLITIVKTDNTDLAIYVDSVEEHRVASVPDMLQGENPITLGRTAYTTSNYYVGSMDDIRIYTRALNQDDIDLLYFGEQLSPPSIVTLQPINLGSTTATLRLISDFGDYNTVGGYFQYKENSSSVWIDSPTTPAPLTNNTIYTRDIISLTPSTLYDYRGVISYDSEIVYGEIIQFSTSALSYPDLEVRGAVVSDISATLRGEVLDIGDYGNFNVFWRYREYPSETYSENLGTQTVSETGIYTYSLAGLTPETQYEQCFFGDVSGTILSGFCLNFTTSPEGAPVIETQGATSLTRTSAQINGEILDLGTFDSVTCNYQYWNEGNSTNKINTSFIPYFVEVGNGEALENLFINTTYYYEFLCFNTERDYSGSGGLLSFDTLSLIDVIEPTMILILNDTTNDSIDLTLIVDNPDAYNVTYYFQLRYLNSSVKTNSAFFTSNDTFIFDTFSFQNLESAKYYIAQVFGVYAVNESSQFNIESDSITIKTVNGAFTLGVPEGVQNIFSIAISIIFAIFVFLGVHVSSFQSLELPLSLIALFVGIGFFAFIGYLPVWVLIAEIILLVGMIVSKIMRGVFSV